ncbi:hypothetical protein P3T43_007147 [Paraburkholderia sp. GAS41]|uniref:hypothetical protein n=1 Tax=Paraburkholderia sp. GAS41 TaxID=3035134 RepID=UPI003D1B12DF
MSAITLANGNISCPERAGIADAHSRRAGWYIAHALVHHHRKSGCVCRASSPVHGVFPRFYPRYLDHRGVDNSVSVTSPLRRVTMTLHARNAKNIFNSRIIFAPVIIRVFACNVGRRALKVPQFPVVSLAVGSSIDGI